MSGWTENSHVLTVSELQHSVLGWSIGGKPGLTQLCSWKWQDPPTLAQVSWAPALSSPTLKPPDACAQDAAAIWRPQSTKHQVQSENVQPQGPPRTAHLPHRQLVLRQREEAEGGGTKLQWCEPDFPSSAFPPHICHWAWVRRLCSRFLI